MNIHKSKEDKRFSDLKWFIGVLFAAVILIMGVSIGISLDNQKSIIKNGVDIQVLKTDVQTLKTDVQTLKTDVQTLKTDVQTLKTDMQLVKHALKLPVTQSQLTSK